MTPPHDAVELSEDDLRVVTAFALECAEPVLHLFEAVAPDDSRPREALAAARVLVDGARRSARQRTAALEAHRAAREVGESPARYAARAAGDAAAAAYVHPIAESHQVGHILRAAACAAHASSLAAHDPTEADRVLEHALRLASPALVAILRRYSPAPTGRTPVARLMTRLDVGLRSTDG